MAYTNAKSLVKRQESRYNITTYSVDNFVKKIRRYTNERES